MSDFLKNLKNAVDNGDFNSDAAKRINEIDEKATEIGNEDVSELLQKRIDSAGVKTVSEDEVAEINSEYEKKLIEIKKQDFINSQIKTLIEMDELVSESIADMFSYIEDIKVNFTEDIVYNDIKNKINELENKYMLKK